MNELGSVDDRNPYGLGECSWVLSRNNLEYIANHLPKAEYIYGPHIIVLWNNYPITFRLKWFVNGCGKGDGEDGIVLEKNRLNIDLFDCPDIVHTLHCRVIFECSYVFWNQSFDIQYINDPKQLMKSWGFPNIPIHVQELLNGPNHHNNNNNNNNNSLSSSGKIEWLKIYAYIRIKKCLDINRVAISNLTYGAATIPTTAMMMPNHFGTMNLATTISNNNPNQKFSGLNAVDRNNKNYCINQLIDIIRTHQNHLHRLENAHHHHNQEEINWRDREYHDENARKSKKREPIVTNEIALQEAEVEIGVEAPAEVAAEADEDDEHELHAPQVALAQEDGKQVALSNAEAEPDPEEEMEDEEDNDVVMNGEDIAPPDANEEKSLQEDPVQAAAAPAARVSHDGRLEKKDQVRVSHLQQPSELLHGDSKESSGESDYPDMNPYIVNNNRLRDEEINDVSLAEEDEGVRRKG